MVDSNEKLRRFLSVTRLKQKEADEITGVKEGRTFSYVRVPAKATPNEEYLRTLVAAYPLVDLTWFFDGNDDWPIEGGAPVASSPKLAPVYELSYFSTTMPRSAPPYSDAPGIWVLVPDNRWGTYGLQRGDQLWVIKDGSPRHETLMLGIDSTSRYAIYMVVEFQDEFEYRQLGPNSDQLNNSAPALVGFVQALQRTLGAGTMLKLENVTGLSMAMLNFTKF